MFERFTADSRQLLQDSQMEARRLRHGFIGCEHLLLALTLQPSVAPTLADAGASHDTVDLAVRSLVGSIDLDASALANVGIDLASVRDRVEDTFGTGALHAAAFALDLRAGHRFRRRERGWLGGRRHRPAPAISPCADGSVPFTGRAKQALEQALRLSLRSASPTVNPEHIASAVVAMSEGIVPALLAELGVDREYLHRALHDRLAS